MKKITINVNGEVFEVDLDTLDKDEAENLGINIVDEEVEIKRKKRKALRNKIIAIVPFVVLIAFFLTGFLVEGAWKWNWTFFLLIPFVSGIKFTSSKKAVSGILSIVLLAVYFLTGFILHCWSINWILFFCFPIIWILCGE